MLLVNNLHVKYGNIHAVRGVSLEVGEREVVMVIGANGAGKSTLLHTIMGLLTPAEGSIQFAGIDLVRVPPFDRVRLGIGFVPEGRRVFGAMTVRENLELGAFRLANRQDVEARIERVYELFPVLKDRQHQLAASMSGGEQQMLAIGRALMSEPRLLIMDEPSMGLSPVLTEHIYEIIASIKATGTSILLVEQNAFMAMSVADRGYVMQSGRIVYEGPVADFTDNRLIREAYLGI